MNKLKVLHTSDWHLGKNLNNLSLIEDQIDVLNEISEICERENPHLVIIAGDVFDIFNPGIKAIEIFYKTLKKLSGNGKRLIFTIAGNHDSPDRIETADPLAKELGIILAGNPDVIISPLKLDSGIEITKSNENFIEINFPNLDFPVRLIFCPYSNEIRLKKFLGINDQNVELRNILNQKWKDISDNFCDSTGVNIMTLHTYVVDKMNPLAYTEDEEEKPVGGNELIYIQNIPESIQYTAIGHLHANSIKESNGKFFSYSGSIFPYSASEAFQDKFVNIIELLPDKPANVKKINLKKSKKIIRKSFVSIDEAVNWLEQNQDIYVELTIKSDNYLSASETKSLYAAHKRIFNLIPEITGQENQINKKNIDLTKSVEELFIDYFTYKNNGSKPSVSLMKVFREVMGKD